MLELLKETGLNFTSGQSLSSKTMNDLNDSLNSLIRTVNKLLKSEININIEEETLREYTLEEAIALIPENRVVPGVKLRFLGIHGSMESYVYNGTAWTREENDIIRGEEW